MNVTQWYASKCYRCNQIKELAIQILMDVLSASQDQITQVMKDQGAKH